VAVTLNGVLLRLGEPDPVLLEAARLLGVEHSERSEHAKAVDLLLADLIDSGPLDGLEEDDVRSLFALEHVTPGRLDLIEGAPPPALKTVVTGRKLEQKLVDAPVRIAG